MKREGYNERFQKKITERTPDSQAPFFKHLMSIETDLIDHCELTLLQAGKVDRSVKSAAGQFLTPIPTARFMASLFKSEPEYLNILDPGAGSGILFSSLIADYCSRDSRPQSIFVTAFENDARMMPHLYRTMALCEDLCRKKKIRFQGTVKQEDFILDAVDSLKTALFQESERYTHAILNPPYKKINNQSAWRKRLDAADMPVSNQYAAFVWLASELLEKNGEIAAITPRSFCNGPYFSKFRTALTESVALDFFHLFQSRNTAFAEDSVLQENIIYHGIKGAKKRSTVISVSDGLNYDHARVKTVPYREIVSPDDPDRFIHLPEDANGHETQDLANGFHTTLADLGINISTGRVVDFRTKENLLQEPDASSLPLLYPCHFFEGGIRWPLSESKKPNALLDNEDTEKLTVPNGNYLLVKRFSAKEERRRIVASLCLPEFLPKKRWGFENHLNYFHQDGVGLDVLLAKGLFVYLNSTFFDQYFRLFSGHTQVNATDLRKIKYPTRRELERLGKKLTALNLNQEKIDGLFAELLKKGS